jgi:hypothetical protein
VAIPRQKESNPEVNEFWGRSSFEELARQQGVRPVERLDQLLGGWPEDQIGDGFEDTLEHWRSEVALHRNEA